MNEEKEPGLNLDRTLPPDTTGEQKKDGVEVFRSQRNKTK